MSRRSLLSILAAVATIGAALTLSLPALAQGKPPKVVASTTWVAAFARAAGATDVTVVAPASFAHPPDYDPRPSDLVAVASADIVLMAPFDGFAQRLRDATGSKAKVDRVDLENTPEKIRSEVTRLAKLLGTEPAAQGFMKRFDAEYANLSAEVRAKIGPSRPVAVAHRFMAYWASGFAGLEVAGIYGPKPLAPAELADLVGKMPGVVFRNGHVERPEGPSAGRAIADNAKARDVMIINFPGANQDLLDVFRENARRIVAVLGK